MNSEPEYTFKLKENPLWGFIRGLNQECGESPIPYVPWLGLDGQKRHPYERKLLFHCSLSAIALRDALDCDGECRPLAFDADKHEELTRFVTSSNIGSLVGMLASEARSTVVNIPAFSASTWLPGFIPALLNWMDSRHEAGSWQKTLSDDWINETDPDRADFLFRDALKNSGNSNEFAPELHKTMDRRQSAIAKRLMRGRKEKRPQFKDSISYLWIIGALWARTPSGILQRLGGGDGSEKTVNRIVADISRLGLTPGRSRTVVEDEKWIERRESEFRKFICV